MKHDLIFEFFKLEFEERAKNVITWFPNGYNSIRVRFPGIKDYIFTYNGKNDWCFETIDHYISTRMKGATTMRC